MWSIRQKWLSFTHFAARMAIETWVCYWSIRSVSWEIGIKYQLIKFSRKYVPIIRAQVCCRHIRLGLNLYPQFACSGRHQSTISEGPRIDFWACSCDISRASQHGNRPLMAPVYILLDSEFLYWSSVADRQLSFAYGVSNTEQRPVYAL